MPYGQLLKKYIEEKELTYNEVSKRCSELGESVTTSYLSKLINGEMAPPSDKKNKVLAEALEGDYKLFALEAYLDKAPKIVVDFLKNMRFSILTSMYKVYENTIPEDQIETVKKSIDKMPLAQLILETNDVIENTGPDFMNSEKENHKIKGFPIMDNAMYPSICEGDEVTLRIQEEYTDGDLLCFYLKEHPNIPLVRHCFIKDDAILAYPYNTSHYKMIKLKYSEIKILGKVTSCIRRFTPEEIK